MRELLIEKFKHCYIIDKFGNQISYDNEKNYHSPFPWQPAVYNRFGLRVWVNHGKNHRNKGYPAAIDRDGQMEWTVNGKLIKELKYQKILGTNKSEFKMFYY